MATSRVRNRAAGVSVEVEVDGLDRTSAAFKQVRRRIASDMATVEKTAAEKIVLPDAKRNAGSLKVDGQGIGSHLVVTKRASGAVLTTSMRGMRARAAGLLEFGGTIRTPLHPKAGRSTRTGRPPALNIHGSPRSVVRTARHYRARRYLQGAAEQQLGAFGEHVRDQIVDFFTDPFEIR